jgi:CRP-like cAMP-binding protein
LSTNSTPDTRNKILLSLTAVELDRLRPCLEQVDLPFALDVYDIRQAITHVYFPEDGMVSVVNITASGEETETGVIGHEGMCGVEAILGGREALNRNVVQLAGYGLRAKLDDVKQEFQRGGTFQESVLVFTRAMMAQISQTALCNRQHKSEKRLAKWLLMCRDRTTSDVLSITQEFAALMLGANRVTLTNAAGRLQDEGLIDWSRRAYHDP